MGKKKETRGRKATGITPKRYFRMSDDDYKNVKDAAGVKNMTASEFIRDVLRKQSGKVLKTKSD